MLSSIFDAFVKESPVSVMMRGLMEYVFRPERLDDIFESHAKVQYTRELLFASLVNLLSTGSRNGKGVSRLNRANGWNDCLGKC